MSTSQNKQLMQEIFSQLKEGNGQLLLDSMADDFCWHMIGSTKWSRSYEGKNAVRNELFAPLVAQFADRYTNTAKRFIVDGEYVVVECQGQVMTKAGKPYNNTYCWVCRIVDGKLQELTEYMDTELVATVLEAPKIE